MINMDKKDILKELEYMKQELKTHSYVLNRIIKELKKSNNKDLKEKQV